MLYISETLWLTDLVVLLSMDGWHDDNSKLAIVTTCLSDFVYIHCSAFDPIWFWLVLLVVQGQSTCVARCHSICCM